MPLTKDKDAPVSSPGTDSPPQQTGTRTTTTTTEPVTNGNGGLKGVFAQYGQMTGIAVIFSFFAALMFWNRSDSTAQRSDVATQQREQMQFIRDEFTYQRQRHDDDMKTLNSGQTDNAKNTMALLAEMKAGREAMEKRTEQQHSQIEKLHEILIKKMP